MLGLHTVRCITSRIRPVGFCGGISVKVWISQILYVQMIIDPLIFSDWIGCFQVVAEGGDKWSFGRSELESLWIWWIGRQWPHWLTSLLSPIISLTAELLNSSKLFSLLVLLLRLFLSIYLFGSQESQVTIHRIVLVIVFVIMSVLRIYNN